MLLWQGHDVSLADALHAPHFIDRSPEGRGSDLASFKHSIVDLYAAFPDFRAETAALLIDDEAGCVVVRWHAQGRHEGSFMGYAPSQARIAFTGIEIIRIETGRIVERWGEWNGAEIMAQLAAAPSRATGGQD